VDRDSTCGRKQGAARAAAAIRRSDVSNIITNVIVTIGECHGHRQGRHVSHTRDTGRGEVHGDARPYTGIEAVCTTSSRVRTGAVVKLKRVALGVCVTDETQAIHLRIGVRINASASATRRGECARSAGARGRRARKRAE
jgi:hypothetical protein